MHIKISADDLETNLSVILSRIRERGEQFVIERDGEEVAMLAPMPASTGITLRELVDRVGDLALPGDGFADDLEVIQASQPPADMPQWPN